MSILLAEGHDYSASSHGVVRAVQHLLPDLGETTI